MPLIVWFLHDDDFLTTQPPTLGHLIPTFSLGINLHVISVCFLCLPRQRQDVDEIQVNYPSIFELMHDLKGEQLVYKLIMTHDT